MSARPAEEPWTYSPDPTIERIWRARAALERDAGGDVRRLFDLAAREAEKALRGIAERRKGGLNDP